MDPESLTLFPPLEGTGPLVPSHPSSGLWVPATVNLQLWPSSAFDPSARALALLLGQLRSLGYLALEVFGCSPSNFDPFFWALALLLRQLRSLGLWGFWPCLWLWVLDPGSCLSQAMGHWSWFLTISSYLSLTPAVALLLGPNPLGPGPTPGQLRPP